MNVILLSGGSGKRLWPLSNDVRAKQFIRFFKSEDGTYISMLENMFNKIKKINPNSEITIATSKEQVSIIQNQIGKDVNLSIEPCRKDTFPAIVLAVSYLYDVKNISKNEVVVCCPIDPAVDDEYFIALKKLYDLAQKSKYNINLMGITPTYPSEKYGYIIPKNKNSEISEVEEFKEKPTKQVASQYIELGALWNGGILAFKIEYLLELAHKIIDFKDYYDLQDKFKDLESISFDYAVLEKENNTQVMKFNGKWKDMGTWNTLIENIDDKIIGKGIQSESCKNTNIINELNIPVFCMGLENVIVVASDNGIIVTDKEQSSYIKPFVEKINQQAMSTEAEQKNEPFLLSPSGKDYLWGGNRLKDDFNKNMDLTPLAETWECSTHPDGPSYVASGKNKGKSLIEVLKEHPEYLGTYLKKNGELPILIKFIDAQKDLSIQVHPNDEYAMKYENGQLGKTEMWYVLDAPQNTEVVHGFNCNMNKHKVKKTIENGTIEKYLNKVPINKDDVFYIKPGTIHAIGAGALIVEIQENSNLSYRLYDYNRVDKTGKLRELHIDKALDVMDYNASHEIKQPIRVQRYENGYTSELLYKCEYFEVHKEKINTTNCKEMLSFQTQSNSFHVLLCIDGCGTLISEKETIPFFKGDCIFVPANSIEFKIHGMTDLLNINC